MFIDLEGIYLNPEHIELVRQADPNNQGFQTELVFLSGTTQLLRTSLKDVIKILRAKD